MRLMMRPGYSVASVSRRGPVTLPLDGVVATTLRDQCTDSRRLMRREVIENESILWPNISSAPNSAMHASAKSAPRILQPKVAVLSYLGNRGECSNPERVATFTVRKMSSGTAAQRRMGCVICGTEP